MGQIEVNDYETFISDRDTSKLLHVGEQVINEEVISPAYMRTLSKKNRRYGYVPILNILGYDLIFADKNETLMSI